MKTPKRIEAYVHAVPAPTCSCADHPVIKARQARTAAAEAALGGVVIEGTGEWVRVTFAAKPAREVLDALRATGFRWDGGSWVGERSKLPEAIGLNGARPGFH